MLADWSAECSADAPVLLVPWHDPESGLSFHDLRADPYALAEITEAEHHPALSRALRSLNAQRSPFLTAKCDAWPLTMPEHAETLHVLALELGHSADTGSFGFTSYIDIIWRERSVFASSHQQKDRLDRIARRAARLPHPDAALEGVLRPAILAVSATLEGFAISLYVTALAADAETAYRRWEAALDDVVNLLRQRELEPARGSATIDPMLSEHAAE